MRGYIFILACLSLVACAWGNNLILGRRRPGDILIEDRPIFKPRVPGLKQTATIGAIAPPGYVISFISVTSLIPKVVSIRPVEGFIGAPTIAVLVVGSPSWALTLRTIVFAAPDPNLITSTTLKPTTTTRTSTSTTTRSTTSRTTKSTTPRATTSTTPRTTTSTPTESTWITGTGTWSTWSRPVTSSPAWSSPSPTSPSPTSPAWSSPAWTSPSPTSPTGSSPAWSSPAWSSPSPTSPTGSSPAWSSPAWSSPAWSSLRPWTQLKILEKEKSPTKTGN
ncbi:Neurofilament medium polypeptide [Anthophora quadrimaculata]